MPRKYEVLVVNSVGGVVPPEIRTSALMAVPITL